VAEGRRDCSVFSAKWERGIVDAIELSVRLILKSVEDDVLDVEVVGFSQVTDEVCRSR